MNDTITDIQDATANIQEKYMSALVAHSDLDARDLGAVDLALGMALADLDAHWRNSPLVTDVESIQALLDQQAELHRQIDALAIENGHLLDKVAAMTKGTVAAWRNGDGAVVASNIPFQASGTPIVIVEAAAKMAAATPAAPTEEADDGAENPMQLAELDDDDEDVTPPFRFAWRGLSTKAMTAIADLELGKAWRLVDAETRKEITLAAVRELQAAQYDGQTLRVRDFDEGRPMWMPTFASLTMTFLMSWKQILAAATA